MKKIGLVGIAALVCLANLVGQWSVTADRRVAGGDEGGIAGDEPDVIVGSLPSIKKWGTVGGITGYSVATTSCNIGNAYLKWCDTNNANVPCTKNEHPVISQNMYRLMPNGQFEQIGMSWVKHGFCASPKRSAAPARRMTPSAVMRSASAAPIHTASTITDSKPASARNHRSTRSQASSPIHSPRRHFPE